VEKLAQHYNAQVVFLQVVEPPPLIVGPEGAQVELRQQDFEQQTKQAESYLAALRGEFREKGIEARTSIVNGPVVQAIINAAEHESADLIAIASHGRSGLSQLFYGSVAVGVLHRIDRPLLVIRSQGDE
jgi:nucleotide-binding universal stress UspA family protein